MREWKVEKISMLVVLLKEICGHNKDEVSHDIGP